MSRILVVDDVAPLAEQYAYDLTRLGGHEVSVATNGPAALAAITEGDLDCVVLDLEMPGMDGFEVLRTLRHRGVEVPVIASGGAAGPADFIAAVVDGGADAVLAASIFHRRLHAIHDIKLAMAAAGIPVRITPEERS